jgi:hypothetical protein
VAACIPLPPNDQDHSYYDAEAKGYTKAEAEWESQGLSQVCSTSGAGDRQGATLGLTGMRSHAHIFKRRKS